MIIRVKIIKCCVDHWWYRPFIGSEFDLDTQRFEFDMYKDTDRSGYCITDTEHNQKMLKKSIHIMEEMIEWNWYIAHIDYEPVNNRSASVQLKR